MYLIIRGNNFFLSPIQVPLGFRIKGVLAPPDGKMMLKAVARR